MQRESFIKSVKNPDKPQLHAVESDSSTTIKPREPLPTIQTYCQSKTFIAHSGINPLIAAASALFSLLRKLPQCGQYQDITSLRDNLIHEVKAFECAAHSHGYNSETILVARYALCATLDEIILQTAWGHTASWEEQTLLYFFQGENWGGEAFFFLLERLQKEPEQHVELLELMYLCLSLGFKGKYQQAPELYPALQKVRDDLYQMIRRQRGDSMRMLSSPIKQFQKNTHNLKNTICWWKLSLITGAVLASIYLGFNFLVTTSSNPLYQNLTEIVHSIHHEV